MSNILKFNRSFLQLLFILLALTFSACSEETSDKVDVKTQTSSEVSDEQNSGGNTGNSDTDSEETTNSSDNIGNSNTDSEETTNSSDNTGNSNTDSEETTNSSDNTSNADANSEIRYGPRALKLLTRVEYQNSVEDLVGINFDVSKDLPFDTLIERYSNNASTPATEKHVDSYLATAEKIAEWSEEHNFQGIVECGFDANGNIGIAKEACENNFLNDFATRVFRRPLNSSELTLYRNLFNDSLTGGDIKVGLKLGIVSLLTAPQFLYRSEAGTSVQDITSNSNSDSTVTLDAANFQVKSVGGAEGTGWNIWSDGYIQHSFELADKALIQITMKGSVANNTWPNMELLIGGEVITSTTVDTNSYKLYEFNVANYAGSQQIQIRFTNDYFQDGQDRNLYVASVSVSGTPLESKIAESMDLSLLDDDAYVLSDYEMATFLSYTLTGSTPDAELLDAAKSGALTTETQLRTQIARLLATERAKEHMGVFASQWLGSNEIINAQKDPMMFPDFTDEVRIAMAAEAKAFFTHVFYDSEQGFSNLFNADYVLVNKPLAKFYGLGNVGTNSTDPKDFVKMDATSIHRGGLMTLGAFLANEADLTKSSPIKRAANTRMRILCQNIPQPDDTIPDLRIEKMEKLLKELDGTTITTRTFIGEITKDYPCAYCHDEIINPLGFAYEDYDASGRYITTDHNGLAINSTGKLIGVNSISDGFMIDLLGGKDISNKFAELEAVRTCFSANVFRYAMDIGHETIDSMNANAGSLTYEEKSDYSSSVSTLTQTLTATDSMVELFTQLGTLDLVRFRKQRNR